MKHKLYSDAHLEAARKLFPDRVDDSGWLERPWTDDEINACKALEAEAFIQNPVLANLPYRHRRLKQHAIGDADRFLASHPRAESLLSVGCGGGEQEIWLAMRHPDVQITAIDNAPYIEGMNQVVEELGLKNITFRNLDLREAALGRFDIVYSNAVIYCIPDESVAAYVQLLADHTKPEGVTVIGTAANISPVSRLRLFLGRSGAAQSLKQTGWMRDWKEVRRFIPSGLRVVRRRYFDHAGHAPFKKTFPFFATLFGFVGQWFYPVSSSSFVIQLRHGEREK